MCAQVVSENDAIPGSPPYMDETPDGVPGDIDKPSPLRQALRRQLKGKILPQLDLRPEMPRKCEPSLLLDVHIALTDHS